MILLIYDLTKRDSFENISQWIEEVTKFVDEKTMLVMVGNKLDLSEEKTVSKTELEKFSLECGIHFFEVSAKTNLNIDSLFLRIAKELLKLQIPLLYSSDSVFIDNKNGSKKKKSGMCII